MSSHGVAFLLLGVIVLVTAMPMIVQWIMNVAEEAEIGLEPRGEDDDWA